MVAISACNSNPFPATYVYESVKPERCTRAKIIRQNPVAVDDFKDVECPSAVIGFDVDEVPSIFLWIRQMQRKSKGK